MMSIVAHKKELGKFKDKLRYVTRSSEKEIILEFILDAFYIYSSFVSSNYIFILHMAL